MSVVNNFFSHKTDVEMQDMPKKMAGETMTASQAPLTFSDTTLLMACPSFTSGDPCTGDSLTGYPLPPESVNPSPSDHPTSTSDDPSLAHPSSPIYFNVSLTSNTRVNEPTEWAYQLKNAIEKRDVQGVERLLEKSESLECFMCYGLTPLHLCIDLYCKDDFQKPLTTSEWNIFSAILVVTKHQDLMDQTDSLQETALYTAIRSGYLDVVQACLAAGAQIHNSRNDTALHIAVKHPHILKHFLSYHNIENSKNDIAYFPIHKAVEYGRVESIELLLEEFGEEQLTWRTRNGQTLLHLAACNGYDEVVTFLLKFIEICLNIHEIDDDGETALFKSTERGQVTVTALLLNHGAVLSDKGKNGRTAVAEIATKFADPLTFLRGVFDECIYESSDFYNGRKKVCVNYEVLTNNNGISQIKVLQELIRWDLSELLAHPMLKSLLYLKWKLVIVQFYVLIAMHATTLVTFQTLYSLYSCKHDWGIFIEDNYGNLDILQLILSIILLYCCIVTLLARECINLKLQRWRYFSTLYIYWTVPGLVFALATATPPIAKYIMFIPYHIFIAPLMCLQAVYLASRLPVCGHIVYFVRRAAMIVIKESTSTRAAIPLIITCISFYLSPELLKKESEFIAYIFIQVLLYMDIFIILNVISTFLCIVSWISVVASIIIASYKKILPDFLSLQQRVDTLCTLLVINNNINPVLGKIKRLSSINRQHHCKIEKYVTNSDYIWALQVSGLNKEENSQNSRENNVEVLYETLSCELQKDIMNAAIKNETKKNME